MTTSSYPHTASLGQESAGLARPSAAYPVKIATPAKHHCPQCESPLLRIWRRPVDRLLGGLTPVHRYRCEKFSCQWQGNFRTNEESPENAKAEPVSTWMAAKPLLLVVGGVVATALAVALATTAWWPLESVALENLNRPTLTHQPIDAPISLGKANWNASETLSIHPAPSIAPQLHPGTAL